MIGSLRGTVLSLSGGILLLDVHGVGYRVFVPVSLLSKKVGDEVILYTHLHVKEDALDLFGFENPDELSLFEKLITVSGVGPKTALGVFTLGTGQEIVTALEKGDVAFFTRVPRLGTKNAQKIIVELKGKIDLSDMNVGAGDRDVVDALIGFGFSEKEARDALKLGDANAETSTRIKMALKNLGR